MKKKKIDRTARSIKRYLKRHGEEKLEDREWVDASGNVFGSKIEAQISSFLSFIYGCLRGGFPIAVSKLFYPMWAFYPFIFVRKDLKGSPESLIAMINHERIHINQQAHIHLTISLPLVFLVFISELLFELSTLQVVGILFSIPFIPTILYVLEFLRTFRIMIVAKERDACLPEITFQSVRENTCFEREAISKCMNENYLKERKLWAVLAYTGWKRFKNYGI